MSDNICIHHTDAERGAWRIGCPICLSKKLSASQQEVARLREALDNANEKIRVFAEKIRAFAKPAVQNLLVKMSTPSPDHKDTERLDWLQKSPFENLSAIRFTTQPCMKHHDVRAAIDAEIERTKIQ